MGGTGQHQRAKRGTVRGWSAASARRQRQWAWSVTSEQLDGDGYSLTLTMVDTPPTSVELHAIRSAYLKRLERMGLVRVHWVIEWQARGTPHMHMAVYFDHGLDASERALLISHWLAVADVYGAGVSGQDWKHITGAVGWLKYLSKHATRGVHHYQRQGHPEGWEKTGRLWGAGGSWPTVEPFDFPDLLNAEFYRVRRLMRSWAYADARRLGDRRRMVMLKATRRTPDVQKSRYLGAAEWVPEDVIHRLVDYLSRDALRAPEGV